MKSNKLVLILLFLVAHSVMRCISSSDQNNENYRDKWMAAKAKYNLAFENAEKESASFNTYAQNMAKIESVNAQGTNTYTLGENQYTHLTDDEKSQLLTVSSSSLVGNYHSLLTVLRVAQAQQTTTTAKTTTTTKPTTTTTKPTTTTTKPTTTTTKSTTTTTIPPPTSANWTYLFNAVEDQGSCGDCYAFAAAGVIEGQYALKYGSKISLSETQLRDCTGTSTIYGNGGCNGGSSYSCLQYAKTVGLVSSATIPYSATYSACENSTVYSHSNRTYVKSYGTVTSGNETVLRNYIAANGPVSVYINAVGNFFSYQSGIYYDASCSTGPDDINHAVVLVGYGTENGTDYWLVRNSWGASWGINGYIKMARNKNNMCQIASWPFYAVV